MQTYSPLRRALGWGVHLYTALGLICGFYFLRAADAGDAQTAFLWMAVALIIDSTDGMMARAVDVKHVVPEYDGARLDDIVDYLNYVFIPMVFALRFHLVPPGWEWSLLCPLIASAYGFCSTAAKTSDGYFTGFPSYWNVTVFYFYVMGARPQDCAVLLVYLSVMVFVPIRYLYPSRSKHYKWLSIALTTVWLVALIVMLLDVNHVPKALAWGSLAFPAYYMGLSFYLHLVRDPVARGGPTA